MPWTDNIPDLSPLNWAGISLLALNVVCFPFLFISGEPTLYDDSEYPVVELLITQHDAMQANIELHDTHEQIQDKHGLHSAENEAVVATSHTKVPVHDVEHDAKVDHEAENTAEMDHETKNQSKVVSIHPDRSCYEIGPLKTDDEQIKLQNLVEIKGMFASVKYTQSNENLGYWVFIPALRSNALARLKVEELKLNGFNDVVLLTRNEPINAISLGVFKDQKNAYKQLLRAQSKGFDAKMDVRYQSLGQMWLDVEVSRQRDLDDGGWSELLAAYPHVQFHPVNCR